jgi:hypothetical protein
VNDPLIFFGTAVFALALVTGIICLAIITYDGDFDEYW